jgi:dolichol-phosphate mannosyltransferase
MVGTLDPPKMKVSIILPTYNEKGNIERLIPALKSCIPWQSEYLVVDDNSPDGTAERVAELMDTTADIRLIVRKNERGLVSAIQRGIDESRGDIILWMDCDFSVPPEKVPELVAQIIDHGADAAIGSRYIPGGADETENLTGLTVLVQKFCTNLLNRCTTFLMQTPFHDWTSGFIAIRADVIRKIPLKGDYGEYFILLMAHLIRDGFKWVEVPYRNVPRTIGESKTAENLLGLIRRGVRYILHVLKARRLKNAQMDPENKE